MEWTRHYREHGLDALVDQRDGRNRAKLTREQTDGIDLRFGNAQALVQIVAIGNLRALRFSQHAHELGLPSVFE